MKKQDDISVVFKLSIPPATSFYFLDFTIQPFIHYIAVFNQVFLDTLLKYPEKPFIGLQADSELG